MQAQICGSQRELFLNGADGWMSSKSVTWSVGGWYGRKRSESSALAKCCCSVVNVGSVVLGVCVCCLEMRI